MFALSKSIPSSPSVGSLSLLNNIPVLLFPRQCCSLGSAFPPRRMRAAVVLGARSPSSSGCCSPCLQLILATADVKIDTGCCLPELPLALLPSALRGEREQRGEGFTGGPGELGCAH